VVNYCPALTAATASNCDVQCVGSFAQAKAVCFYVTKYLVKEGAQLKNSLTAVRAAFLHNQAHPSVAPDSGTNQRTASHLLTRMVNAITGDEEYGAQTAALANLRWPSNLFTHAFEFVFIWPALRFVRQQHVLMPPASRSAIAASSSARPVDFELLAQEVVDEVAIGDSDDDDEGDDAGSAFVVSTSGPARTLGFVAQHDTYRFRPVELEAWSLYEFVCCVDVRKKRQLSRNTPADDDHDEAGSADDDEEEPEMHENKQKSRSGRRANGIFALRVGHPQHGTHELVLRSKIRVPLLAGRSPPSYGGYSSDRQSSLWRVAEKFAAYCITLHCPWSLETGAPTIALVPEALRTWTQQLQASPDAVEQGRLRAISLLANSKTSTKHLLALSTWRNRAAHVWSAAERESKRSRPERAAVTVEAVTNALRSRFATLDPNAEHNNKAISKAAACAARLASTFDHEQAVQFGPWCNSRNDASMDNLKAVAARVQTIQSADNPENSVDAAVEVGRQPSTGAARGAFNTRPDPELRQQQNSIFEEILHWLNEDHKWAANPLSGARPAAFLRLIVGQAGTGKSYLIRKLMERTGGLRQQHASMTITCAAAQGLPASALPGGRTIHSLACIDVRTNSLQSSSSASVARAKIMMTRARVLVLDEVSAIPASLLEMLDTRLREFKSEPSLPFGGLAVVMMGDFAQLPPVGTGLLSATEASKAGTLFRLFKRRNLTEQLRAEGDVEWSRVISYFRDPTLHQLPVKASGILTAIRTLSAADLAADPLWADAVTITGTNVTRQRINQEQCRRFARRRGQAVIAWKFRFDEPSQIAVEELVRRSGVTTEALLQPYAPEITFYFASGAPGFIVGSNVNTTKRITNNTKVILRSLTLNPSEGGDAVWNAIATTNPGDVYWLKHPPLSVNVHVPSLERPEWPDNETIEPSWQHGVVIPILERAVLTPMKSAKGIKSVAWHLLLQYYRPFTTLPVLLVFLSGFTVLVLSLVLP